MEYSAEARAEILRRVRESLARGDQQKAEFAAWTEQHAEHLTQQPQSLMTRRAGRPVIHKTFAARSVADDPMSFILSDATIDRYGDTIDPNGWDLRNFLQNPIALFNHN